MSVEPLLPPDEVPEPESDETTPENPENFDDTPPPELTSGLPADEPEAPWTMPEIWLKAVTEPREGTYARIIAHPQATLTNALLWISVVALLTSALSAVSIPISLQDIPDASKVFNFSLGFTVCMVPAILVFTIIGFLFNTALVHWAARFLKGEGEFEKLAFAASAYYVPVGIVSAGLSLLGMIPYIGIFFSLITAAISFYALFLQILAVKVVYGFKEWGRAVGAVFLPIAFIFILVFVCACLVGLLVAAIAAGAADTTSLVWLLA